MIEDYWLQVLISPNSGQALEWEEGEKALCTADGTERFAVNNGVPRLLPTEQEHIVSQGEIHRKLQTDFHYREHYRQDAEVFDYFLAYEDGASRHEARRLHETIIAKVPATAESLLDVGCGNAWVAQYFCPRGKRVVSLDVAPRNPEKAIQLYPGSGHLGLVADVYALPFRPGTFDCIIAAEIIEHVADPRLFMERLLEVLRPGGTLIITTPFDEKIPYSLCVHCNRPTPQHAHIHSFDQDHLARLVRRDQVQLLKMETFSNKALTKLQTHVFLQWLPRGLWRLADRLANLIVRKPARLLMQVVKTKV